MHINGLCINHVRNGDVTGAFLASLGHMQGHGCTVAAMGVSSEPDVAAPFYRDAIPRPLLSVAYRTATFSLLAKLAERRYLSAFDGEDVAVLWPATSVDVWRALRARGATVVAEKVNSHDAACKAILEAERDRAGFDAQSPITDANVAHEREVLALSDFVYCSNPLAHASLVEHGIPSEKILDVTYGVHARHVLDEVPAVRHGPDEPLTVLYVGKIGLRKGVHRLIEAWRRAKPNARLRLVGKIEAPMEAFIAEHLGRDGIEHIPFVDDPHPLFRAADVFACPTLEDGGPIVTLEAFAAGLPVLASPYAAGWVLRDDVEGLIADPYDVDAWAEALTTLCEDAALRDRLGRAALERARRYTWDKVGAHRRDVLAAALAERAGTRASGEFHITGR